MAVYYDKVKRCPSLPPAFDMYLIVYLMYLINVPVHTCTALYSIHQVQVQYILQVPIHQASSDVQGGLLLVVGDGGGGGELGAENSFPPQRNRSGSGVVDQRLGAAGTFISGNGMESELYTKRKITRCGVR
jgi:hypothetical protein